MTRQLLFALAALCCASGQAYNPSREYEIKTDYTLLHFRVITNSSTATIPVEVLIDGRIPESKNDYSEADYKFTSSDTDVATAHCDEYAISGQPFYIRPKAKGSATLSINWGDKTHEMQVRVHEDFSVALYDGETAVDNITLAVGEKKTFTVRKTVDGVVSDLSEGDIFSVFNGQFYNCTKSGTSQITFEGTRGGAAEQQIIATIRLSSNDPTEYYDNIFTKQIKSDITVTQNDNFTRTDFRDETVYHALITRFYDGDPKNNVLSWDRQEAQSEANDPDWRGDFAGLIAKLDYIKALGFTAIRINPVVQNGSGRDYHGNHPTDFNSVDLRLESRTAWGATADVKFQNLVDAAHAKGLKVVLDVVLNSISSYGENELCPMFTRSDEIKNQASESAALTLIPGGRLSAEYADKDTYHGRLTMRNECFTAANDPQNLLHHQGEMWNWDDSGRWWGQTGGEKVDINTENEAVADYLVDAYGRFIAMGVDAFCITDAAHIAPLTLNKLFIPQFAALGEEHKDKRPGQAPFAMFADVAHNYSDVVYRGMPNMSPYFYTWQSPDNLMAEYDGNAEWWTQQTLDDNNPVAVGPMAVCNKDTDDKSRSLNAWLSGTWREPDYTQASGLYVVDTPLSLGFSNTNAFTSLLLEDNYYNDATFNMVCAEQEWRLSGSAEEWADNLTRMFTLRGIPSVIYGTEVEFQKGKSLDVGNFSLGTTGHAYFGQYLEGNVSASDFGVFTAEGNVAETLGSDLAQHIIALNKIRAAVPALRKGQYTFDGCKATAGPSIAFKRAWEDSYALVAVNGGPISFMLVPDGTYTDIVTGKTYTPSNGSINVSAPASKGQLNVLVKDWTGGRVVDDGKFIYAETPAEGNGSASFTDPGTTEYFTADDADTSGIIAPEAEAAAEGEVFYNLQGIEVKRPSRGIYIMRRGTTLRKISL